MKNYISKAIILVMASAICIIFNGTYSYAMETDTSNGGYFVYGSQEALDNNVLENRSVEYNRNSKNEGVKKSILKATPNTTEPIIHEGKYKNIEWKIYKSGSLYVTGNGEFKEKNTSADYAIYAPWHEYNMDIKTAVIDIENTTDFSQMFWECYNLKSVYFVNENRIKPTNMQGMFADCYSLEVINWGRLIDTSDVKNMNALYANCIMIDNIDVSSFVTTELDNTSYMFYGCENLTNIIWGEDFKTNKIYNMSYMFAYCYSLRSLDISNFICSSIHPRGTGNILFRCNELETIKSPQIMGDASIELYVNEVQKKLYGWIDNSNKVVNNIPEKQQTSIEYKKSIISDYWNRFTNEDDYFNRKGLFYYISDSDYNRLIENMTTADRNVIDDSLYYINLGECYGMSSWVSLQNNGWVELQSGLKNVDISDDIVSKISFYQVQQFMDINSRVVDRFASMNEIERINSIMSSLYSGNVSIISYSYLGDEGQISHAVCGLGLRNVQLNERTDQGIDVSQYSYCVVVYDPNENKVSENSDCNIYFNTDGNYYIPKYNASNINDKSNNFIRRVVFDEAHINTVDYYTGELKKETEAKEYSHNILHLNYGRKYSIKWNNVNTIIDEKGLIAGSNQDIKMISDECSEKAINRSGIALIPKGESFTIGAEEQFNSWSRGENYTTFTDLESAGEVTYKEDGGAIIRTVEESNKLIRIGLNQDDCLWRFIKVKSDKGLSLSIVLEEEKIVIEGDDLTNTMVILSDEYDEKINPIIIPINTTRAEFTRGEDGSIFIEHNGDKEDDNEEILGNIFETEFEVTDSWDGGYNALLRLKNISEEYIDNWSLSFDYIGEISNIWNAEIIKHEDNSYIIKNVGYNQDIAPGQTIEIGISGQQKYETEPTDYELISSLDERLENLFDVSVCIYDDWDSGCNGEFIITNNGEKVIEDWVLEFDYEAQLINIWNAEIIKHEGNHYIIKNVQHNANIQSGQSISVGFNGGEGAASVEPTGYRLYSY